MDQETKTALRALSDHYNELRHLLNHSLTKLTAKVETTYVETHHLATDVKDMQDRLAKLETLDPTQRIEVLHTQVCDVMDLIQHTQRTKPQPVPDPA